MPHTYAGINNTPGGPRRRLRIVAALGLGAAVAGIYYTEVSGLQIHHASAVVSGFRPLPQTQAHSVLARAGALVSTLLMLAALWILVIDRRLARLHAVYHALPVAGRRRSKALVTGWGAGSMEIRVRSAFAITGPPGLAGRHESQ